MLSNFEKNVNLIAGGFYKKKTEGIYKEITERIPKEQKVCFFK